MMAVLVMPIGEAASLREVAKLLAFKFDLVVDSLIFRHVGPVEFMVLMEDEESTINLASNNNTPMDNGSIWLHC